MAFKKSGEAEMIGKPIPIEKAKPRNEDKPKKDKKSK